MSNIMKVIRSNDGSWKNLEVIAKNVYGNETIYPNDERSKAFLEALGLKTFTDKAIRAAATLGYQLVTTPTHLKNYTHE